MGFSETMIFYLLIGLGVATAVYLSDSRPNRHSRGFQVATAVVFWPLYLPILLSGPRTAPMPESRPDPGAGDALSQTIAQVEAELGMALASLDGWVEDVLAHETDRFHELGIAWRAQAARIREMDRLLARVEPVTHAPMSGLPDPEVNDRNRQSEQARRANLVRLHEVRNRAYEDLTGTLTRVRELVSMIHLAKFTGAPASRAEELVGQIAAAIEGISAVTWQDAPAESKVGTPPTGRVSHTPPTSEEILPCDYSTASATSSPRI